MKKIFLHISLFLFLASFCFAQENIIKIKATFEKDKFTMGFPDSEQKFVYEFSARPKDIEKVQKAVDEGDAESMRILAMEYYYGDLLDKNISKAISLTKAAVEAGNEYAKSQMLFLEEYVLVENAKKNLNKVLEKAQAGDIDSIYALALYYARDDKKTNDPIKAAEYAEQGAQQKHAICLLMTGDSYYFGRGKEKDYNLARRYYQRAAKLGVAKSSFVLFTIYYEGLGVNKNEKKAYEQLLIAAEGGCADAQYNLGYFYANGGLVKKDTEKAIYWYKRAAAQENAKACFLLGDIYTKKNKESKNPEDKKIADYYFEKGANLGNQDCQNAFHSAVAEKLINENLQKRAKDFEEKSAKGDVYATYEIAKIYAGGAGAKHDYVKAAELFEKCIKAGYTKAYLDLSRIYLIKNTPIYSQEKSLEIYKRAIAAKEYKIATQMGGFCISGALDGGREMAMKFFKFGSDKGDPEAMCNLAVLYDEDGDYVNSKKYFIMSANEGHLDALALVGARYALAMKGFEKDSEKSFTYILRATEKGCVESMRNMGNWYLKIAQPANPQKALVWYEKAAEKGDVYSQLFAAKYYLNEKSECFDVTQGVKWLRKAADKNDAEAMYILGKSYYEGKLVEKDEKKAFEYISKSANKKNIDAISLLCNFYIKGIACAADTQKAIELIEPYTYKGNSIAMMNLARIYAFEKSNPDLELAKAWYDLSLENGYKISDEEKSKFETAFKKMKGKNTSKKLEELREKIKAPAKSEQ